MTSASTWVRTAVPAVALTLLTACSPHAGAVDPGACTVTVSEPEETLQVLAEAGAGARVCVTGDGLREVVLRVERSGTPQRPLSVVGVGARVGSVVVEADHVVVEGFATAGGDGIALRGRGLVVRRNEVRDAGQDGISCAQVCSDVLVEDNVVTGADGSGIMVEGQRVTVRGNTVSGSVRREAPDADGIRFFGSGLEVVGNTITDISDDGYVVDPPHTDCFQTFDNSSLPTVDAVVTDNVCRAVDHQCLIATAEEAGRAGEVGRSRGILFARNVCDVAGAQAVLVQWLPGVTVRDNTFAGPGLLRAAIFLDGSSDGEFVGNDVPPSVPPYEVDGSSQRGFTGD